jgi:hypothetical protein
MPDPWVTLTISTLAILAAGLYLLTRSPKPVVYANPREERLTHMVARVVGCSLAQGLPAVRREVQIAPSQSDETLVKRAAYHYSQELSETPCQVYRDPKPG